MCQLGRRMGDAWAERTGGQPLVSGKQVCFEPFDPRHIPGALDRQVCAQFPYASAERFERMLDGLVTRICSTAATARIGLRSSRITRARTAEAASAPKI